MTKDVCWWSDYVVDDNGTVYRKKDGVALKQYIQKKRLRRRVPKG